MIHPRADGSIALMQKVPELKAETGNKKTN